MAIQCKVAHSLFIASISVAFILFQTEITHSTRKYQLHFLNYILFCHHSLHYLSISKYYCSLQNQIFEGGFKEASRQTGFAIWLNDR